MEEQYCLKWNNHQTTLLTVLTGLMDTERLADCILSAEGKSLKAHQVIISACSPYLERLLNETRQPGYMPILIFSDLAYDELVAMKEYMYKGEVNIRQDALDSFLKAACNLQIKGLADGGGGGGSDEGGGGSKRKAPPDIADSPVRAGRRRRRESRESDNQEMLPEQLAQPMPAKKQNVFTAKVEPFEPAPVVKMEPIMDQPPMPQPQIQHTPQLVMKPEPQDQPEPETHDLTGLDDDEDYDYEMPGTSQPDLSQDISSWQMDNSMHSAEDFAASQSMNTSASQPGQSSQGDKLVPKKRDLKSKKYKSSKKVKCDSDNQDKSNSGGESSSKADGKKVKDLTELMKDSLRQMPRVVLNRLPADITIKAFEQARIADNGKSSEETSTPQTKKDSSELPTLSIKSNLTQEAGPPQKKGPPSELEKLLLKPISNDKTSSVKKKVSTELERLLDKPISNQGPSCYKSFSESLQSSSCESTDLHLEKSSSLPRIPPTVQSRSGFKPSSSLKKKLKRLGESLDVEITFKSKEDKKTVGKDKRSNIQPLEFIDLSLSGGQGKKNKDQSAVSDDSDSPVDPLAPEQGTSGEQEDVLTSFPLFNFNRSDTVRIIDDSSPQNSAGGNDNVNVSRKKKKKESSKKSAGEAVVPADKPLIPKPAQSRLSLKEFEVAAPVSEEKDDEAKKKKVDKTKRRQSQDGKRGEITLRVSMRGPGDKEVYSCMICSGEFKRERDLLVHGLLKHGETSPLNGIQCNDCDHITSTVGSLYSHQNHIHLKKPKFKCPHCIYEGFEPNLFHTHLINNHAKMITRNKITVRHT